MTDEEKQYWELEHGRVMTAYELLLADFNLTPIYEANNGKSGCDS